MSHESTTQIASFIWSICNLLRGPYKRNEYRKVILPMTVLRRFNCLLADTKDEVLKLHEEIKGGPETLVDHRLRAASKRPFYNTSPFGFDNLLNESDQLAANLNAYILGFSPNVRDIMLRFKFEEQITKMDEKNQLYEVVKAFRKQDLSEARVDNVGMGYVFEELIRIGAEQSNEEAGEHFTPREVIKLMVMLLLTPEMGDERSHVVRTIYDPACGTGGMLSVAEKYLKDHNADAQPLLYGQDWNDEAWAVCKSDMLIKGEDADNIRRGDTFTEDRFKYDDQDRPYRFDYMLANPPFGVEWKQQQKALDKEHDNLGYDGRFGAGLPRINDGSLLFLQHMLSKMRPVEDGGSRIGIVFNGSPLFTGDAGSGESDIRKWIIENDWLEGLVALPDQLFYNTGISTYIWILTNRKEARRRGKVYLLDGRNFAVKMKKSLGQKRYKLGDGNDGEAPQIQDLSAIYGLFEDGATRTFTLDGKTKERVVGKTFDNADFGFQKITVERPLRLNFMVTPERVARLEDESGFASLAKSKRKEGPEHDAEVAAGRRRQQEIREMLHTFAERADGETWRSKPAFEEELRTAAKGLKPRLTAGEEKVILGALSERDERAEVVLTRGGRPEPDPELRDTENVPLKEEIDAYFAREVLPHVPDAWIDRTKTKVGYEIPFNRLFYVYEPPRPLEEIEADLRLLEGEITRMLAEVTA